MTALRAESETKVQTSDRIQALRYPAIQKTDQTDQTEKTDPPPLHAPWDLSSLLPGEDRLQQNAEAVARAKREVAELEIKVAHLERELPLAAERSRLAGEEEGRRKQADEFARALLESRASITSALEAFSRDQQEYFRRVEAEAVKLALAIARKVLHREAQMDPLLLRGAVRTALDRLDETSKITFHVSPSEATGWEKVLAQMPGQRRPSLVEDARLQPGGCSIESQIGTIELSIDVQLEEIERGFFDLLDQRLPAGQANMACAQCGGHAGILDQADQAT
jgi:flagellar assembly protein FliH